LKEGKVSSKKECGEWGVKVLPHGYQGLVKKCLDEYIGEAKKSKIDNQIFLDFAYYMLNEIQQEM
jgi:hypothetical protein